MADHRRDPRALEAERRFRKLLEDEGLDPPDEVLHETDPDELVFLWHEEKVAIVVDLQGTESAASAAEGARPPV